MYSPEHYDQFDATFVEDLRESQQYVWQAAQWLSQKGYNVTVRKTHVRPHAEQMREYADNGDIEIIQRVEVKRRKLAFTCREDYPYKTVFVDVAHTFDNAICKPYAYIIINESATHCLIVKGETSKQWIKSTKLDRTKNRERTFYECPVELCQFFPFALIK